METQELLEIIKRTESPLKKQLLMVGLLTSIGDRRPMEKWLNS